MTSRSSKTQLRRVWLWVGLLAALSMAVKLGYLTGLDYALKHWIVASRTQAGEAAANIATFFGSLAWTIAFATIMSLWWLRVRSHSKLVVFWIAWLAGFLIQVLLRYWVSQLRPDTAAVPASMSLAVRYDLAGFTSGHAFRSAFLYGWWANALKKRGSVWARAGVLGCSVLILLVGATRVYLGRHWVSDVVGAWLLAAMILTAAELLGISSIDRRNASRT